MSALLLAVLASTAAPDAVVVYPDRAHVTRTTQVSCGTRTAVRFENVPPAAAVDSFRARVSAGTVDGLRAERIDQKARYGAEAEALTKKLVALSDEARALDDGIAQVEAQRTLAAKLMTVAEAGLAREFAAEKPDPKTWQQAWDAPLTASLQAAKQLSELNAKRLVLGRTIEETEARLGDARGAAARESYLVEVLVTCPAGSAAQLSLSYLVGGAAWVPSYEARANEAAQRVDLTTLATVTQSTGEDWADVQLVLSTAVPSENATPPALKKLLVSTIEQPPVKKVLTRRDEYVASADVAFSSGSGAGLSGTRAPMAAANQGLSVQLAVPERARILGNGTPVRLAVGSAALPAKFVLKAMPKLMPGVFRTASVTNTGAWPLLPGPLDAFRSTGLVARHGLERVAQGAPFTLTFGSDETLRTKRVVLEELSKDAGLFGSKRRFSYAYRFELSNHGAKPAEVVLEDQLPVAEVNDIDVVVDTKTTAGFSVAKATGVGAWAVTLKPQEKRSLELRFAIDVPTSYDLGGL